MTEANMSRYRVSLPPAIPVILLASLLGSVLLPSHWGSLALFPCSGSSLSPFTYATYWLVAASPLHWLLGSASIVVSLLVVGSHLSPQKFVLLWLGGAVAAGAVYSWLTAECVPLVGQYMVAWSFAGYALFQVGANWRSSSIRAKIYAAFVGLSIASLFTLPLAFAACQLAALSIGGVVFAQSKYRVRPKEGGSGANAT